MATLQPAAGWDEVYQLDVTDPAQGGPGGVLNRQPQALLNRTAYLRTLIDSIEAELQGKAPFNHSHDASAITSGMLDPARIPILPSQKQIPSAGDLAALTMDQQAQVDQGTLVTTTDGYRWVYTGSGSKTTTASYIQLADITPEWSAIQNKPSTFPPSAHGHAIQDVAGLQAALNAKADSANAFATIDSASTLFSSMIACKFGKCVHGSALTLPSFGACTALGILARPARMDEIVVLNVGEASVGWGTGGEATGWTDSFTVDSETLAVTAIRAISSGGGGANGGGTGSVNFSLMCIRKYP